MTGIDDEDRTLGTYVCGTPGTGKSSLLQEMILWDIMQEHGVCVIDPTAQLIKTIIAYIPSEHLDRVVHFTTSGKIPIDFFSYRDDDERQELVTDIANIIDLSTAPVAKHYLTNAIIAFFEANENPAIPRPCTLFDIPQFFQNKKRMLEILSYCPPERAYDFPPHISFNGESVNALLIRFSQITNSKMLRTVLGSQNAILKVSKLIAENKILLVDLKETPNDQIVGSIIAAKIQHAIFARRNLPNLQTCKPYHLYIDECDVILKFAEARFEAIINRARKYKLCMTLANPTPKKLPEKIRESLDILGNWIIFNLTPNHASIFKDSLTPEVMAALPNMPKFRAVFRTNNRVYTGTTPTFRPLRENGNAEYVRQSTLRYRPPESCQNPEKSHTEEHGKPEPQATPPTTPHHAGGDSGAPDLLRAQEQRPGGNPPKKRADKKRPPNDKPEPEAS